MRTYICQDDAIQVFHLINRCVRRTHLCRKDRRSGKDYSHSKEWIRERLEELAGIFPLNVPGFEVLSREHSVMWKNVTGTVYRLSIREMT
ncbi:MAG: hypothetical protein U0936_10145 [Planctomycetaceae bacterium]